MIDAETRRPIPAGFVAYTRKRTGAGAADVGDVSNAGSSVGVSTVSSKGEFKFESVPAGRYELEANSLGALTGDTNYFSDKTEFEVTHADLSNLEVKVHLGASIIGIVVVENSDDPNVLSRLSQLFISVSGADGDSQESVSRISADGSFRLGGLKPGTVRFQVDELGGSSKYHVRRVEQDGVELAGTVNIQANQQVAGVKIVLAYGVGIIRGRVVIEGGEIPPRSSLRVTARLVGSEETSGSAAADRKGDFTIDNLPLGTYEIEAMLYSRAKENESQPRASLVKQTVVVSSEIPVEVTLILNIK